MRCGNRNNTTCHNSKLPWVLRSLLCELDQLLELLANKAMLHSESEDDPTYPGVVMLTARRLIDQWQETPAQSIPGGEGRSNRRHMEVCRDRSARTSAFSSDCSRSEDRSAEAALGRIDPGNRHLIETTCLNCCARMPADSSSLRAPTSWARSPTARQHCEKATVNSGSPLS